MRKWASCLVLLFFVAVSFAEEPADSTLAQKERCPVCGMFVSMFADQNATIEFDDSTKAVMCGPKDMFKYYLNMKRYNPSKSRDSVTKISVKDYYSKNSIDAMQAFYVIWSDVYGPMGHEPIPFEKEEDAKKFLREHKGKKILGFRNINQKVLLSLDNP